MVALTRADAEKIIVTRLGGYMTEAGMAVSIEGNNDDLDTPLAWAARRIGLTPTLPTTVTDSDLSGLGNDEYDDFLDLAEFRVLDNVYGNLAYVDVTAGPRKESLSQLAKQVKAALDAKRERIRQISEAPGSRYIELDFVAEYESV